MTLITGRKACPRCGTAMWGAGKKWSGGHRVQRWLCPGCGRTAQSKYEAERKGKQ